MRNSIFEQLENKKTNAGIEVDKINEFLNKTVCSLTYSMGTVYLIKAFDLSFKEHERFSSYYISLSDMLQDRCKMIYSTSPSDRRTESFFNDYLTFVEILMNLFHGVYNILYRKDELIRFRRLVTTGLQVLGYEIVERNGKYLVKLINPIAESVAMNSSKTIASIIEEYLCIRANNIDDKLKTITSFCIETEPLLKEKANGQLPKIGEIRKYTQLIRHRKENLEKRYNLWFYENEEQYIDNLFDMLILALQTINCSKIFNDFEKNYENR